MFRLWPPPNADEAMRRIDLGLIVVALVVAIAVALAALVSQLPTHPERGSHSEDVVGVPGRSWPPSRPARISREGAIR